MSVPAPRVSVCISTYNRSHYLRQAIESVLAQTYQDFELIVSDDRSPDDTAEVVAQYRDPRLRYARNDRNLGMVGNYNRCLELARGEFIGIFDDDDLYLPHMLETTVAALEAHPDAGFVYGAAEEIDTQNRPVGIRRSMAGDARLEPAEAYGHFLGAGRVPQPTTLLRARAIGAVGRYDPSFGPWCDADMWLRLASRFPVLYLDQVLARYRLTEASATQSGERDGQAAIQLRSILKKALASPPAGRRPPFRVVRRACREVARYELAIAFKFLYREDYRSFRKHSQAALTLAPELLVTGGGLAALMFGAASLAGTHGPHFLWGLRDWVREQWRLTTG